MAASQKRVLSILFVYFALFLLNTHPKYKGNGFRRLFLRDINGLLDDGYPVWSYLQFIRLKVGYKQESLPSKYGVSFPIYRSTKHGTVCLSLPASLFVMDLTICVDISRNPGPSEEFIHRQNLPSFSNPHRPCLDAHTAQQKLNYSRMEMLSLGSVFQPFINNVVRNTPNISVKIPVHITNRVSARNYHCVRAGNLVKINISTEGCFGDKTRNIKKLHLSVLNARSINNKSLLIKDYVVEKQIDMLAITETWLKAGEVSDYIIRDICPKGYKFIHCPREYARGGGIGLLFKQNLKIKKLQTRSYQSFELMELLLNANSSTYRIIVIYRPPSSSINKLTYSVFLEEFTTLLEHISLAPGKLIIVGDFNCHVDEGGSNALKFLELLQIFNLEQHVHVPTHNNGHTLDLIITRKDETRINNLKVFNAAISDHFVLHCNVDLAKPRNVKSDISYRKLGDIDMLKFRQNILSSELYTSPAPTLEERCNQYDLVLSTLLENHAPLRKKTVTIRPMAPWYNEDIKEQKIVRRCKERRWRKSGLQVDRQAYVDQCIRVKNTISKAKMEYYSSLVQDAGTDSGRLFQIVNRFLHRKPEKLYPAFDSSTRLANQFAHFFNDKISKIKQGLQISSSSNTPFFSQLDNPKMTCCLDEFTPTTIEELSDILKKTKLKSCGLDPIPAKVLSAHIDVILPIVTDIVNSSFETSYVPSSFKKAALHPTLKNSASDYEEFSNFRPISNLKFISKMTEKVVALRLLYYLRSNGLEELYQSAYKQFHSCETALVRVQNDILREIDGNSGVILLLLDLSAAFDTVDHMVLLQRMSSKFGIKGDALNWFRSYLSDRSQTVYVNGATSDNYDVVCGVPQGSVLGPILYLMYTSPIGDILRSHGMNFHLYADDTQIYVSFNYKDQNDLEQVKSRVEACLVDIMNWMSENKLMLNTDKTELLILSSKFRAEPVFPVLTVGSDIITPTSHARNIGVTFDKFLTMSIHINNICKSAFYHLRNIARARRYLSFHTTEQLIHAFVTVKVDNANALLYGLPNDQIGKLQRVLNSAARLLTGSHKYNHITPILIQLHWLPVEQRIIYKIILLTFKALNGLAPQYIADMISHYEPIRCLRSSKANLLNEPRFNVNGYGGRAFYATSPRLWNKLPASIRACTDLPEFKSKLKTHMFKIAYDL